MNTGSSRFFEFLYALLRFMTGALFAVHGAQKLFGFLSDNPGQGTAQGLMLVAGIIEFGGGVLIAIGLLTRVAAFISSGEMAVAYFMAHAPQAFWPIKNKGELAVVYCFVFLFIAASGGGRYSLDAAMSRARTEPRPA